MGSRSGSLSRRKAKGNFPRPHTKGSHKGPLRKIVGHDERGREVLECGHVQRPVRDIIGETNADRRRCAKCKAALLAAGEGGGS